MFRNALLVNLMLLRRPLSTRLTSQPPSNAAVPPWVHVQNPVDALGIPPKHSWTTRFPAQMTLCSGMLAFSASRSDLSEPVRLFHPDVVRQVLTHSLASTSLPGERRDSIIRDQSQLIMTFSSFNTPFVCPCFGLWSNRSSDRAVTLDVKLLSFTQSKRNSVHILINLHLTRARVPRAFANCQLADILLPG